MTPPEMRLWMLSGQPLGIFPGRPRIWSEPAPDLVVGSIFGIRSFQVDPDDGPDGKPDELFPPFRSTRNNTWRPGWNTAHCHGRTPAPVEMACACGFYAFTEPDPSDGMFHWQGHVVAIIEAAGTTVQATRGFRAQRARVVAIVNPLPTLWWATLFGAVVTFLAALLNLSNLLAGVDVLNGFLFGLNSSLCAYNSWRMRVMAKARRRTTATARAFDARQFRTRKAAVRAFPLGIVEPGRKAG